MFSIVKNPGLQKKVASPLPSSLSVASVLSDALSVPVSICKFSPLESNPSPFRLDALDCVKRDSIV